jgi:HNH endonuclease
MSSLALSRLNQDERTDLERRLFEVQGGKCFICEDAINLTVHAGTLDVDHVEPSAAGGKDDESNWALTHASCNRSKQDANLYVARVLARFQRLRARCELEERAPNLADVLAPEGGASASLGFQIEHGQARYALSAVDDDTIRSVPLYRDELSGMRYFFTRLPIEYLHHDDRINPRSIGSNIRALVKEFYSGNPQLHVALAWVDTSVNPSEVKVFDGQHKAAAQVLLGVRWLPIRVFVDPDPQRLLDTNTRAGSTLRQVAFDKSVLRSLGHSLFNDRVRRYRKDVGLADDDESFSEAQLSAHFRGEGTEIKKYVLDWIRDSVAHHADNRLVPFIEFGGKSAAKPLSYSTVDKSFFSLFIYQGLLETGLDFRAEEGKNPRWLEIDQIVGLMNIVADEIYLSGYDTELGSAKIEFKVQRGDAVPDGHLRAHRMAKEEVMRAWLRIARDVVRFTFTATGQAVPDDRLFQHPFSDQLWTNLENFVRNLKKLPFWVNHELAATAFGGKRSTAYWQHVFQHGAAPDGQRILTAPLDVRELMEAGAR